MNITPGLKFKSYTFAANAEVVEVRPDRNEVDVKLTHGNCWVEKNMSLVHMKDRFEQGLYYPVKNEPNQFGFI